MSNNLKRKRFWIVLIIILVLIAGAVVAVWQWQKNNLAALKYAGQYTQEELEEKNQQLDNQIQQIVEQLPDVDFNLLSEEEQENFKKGELSYDEAMAIITKKNSSKEEPAQRSARTNEIIAKFYLLKAEYLGSIDSLIAQAKAEYIALHKEDKTFSSKMSLFKKYAQIGSGMEAACDARVNTLLGELETELKATGQSTSIIAEIKAVYNEEKKVKKAALIDKYYPKS